MRVRQHQFTKQTNRDRVTVTSGCVFPCQAAWDHGSRQNSPCQQNSGQCPTTEREKNSLDQRRFQTSPRMAKVTGRLLVVACAYYVQFSAGAKKKHASHSDSTPLFSDSVSNQYCTTTSMLHSEECFSQLCDSFLFLCTKQEKGITGQSQSHTATINRLFLFVHTKSGGHHGPSSQKAFRRKKKRGERELHALSSTKENRERKNTCQLRHWLPAPMAEPA